MKILVVGSWHSNIYEEAVYNALNKLSHDVYKFSWREYFNNFQYDDISLLAKFSYEFRDKFSIGNIINKINNELLKKIKDIMPEVVFIYRGTHIKKETLLRIKQINENVLIVGYNNDDPFSNKAFKPLWRHFKKCIPYYDINFVYRHGNIDEYKAVGAKNVYLLRAYYIKEKNYRIGLDEKDRKKYESDVVLIAHYESDGREKYLEEILEKGFRLKLFGSGWNNVIRKSRTLFPFYPVFVVRGDEYNKALSGTKIALCFLSKLNRDTYTRRCFEIPATKTLMLSEYTDDLNSMFREGIEAEYFRNKEEMIEKIRYYLSNDDKREEIAQNGYNRVVEDGHDVVSRMKYAMDIIASFQ